MAGNLKPSTLAKLIRREQTRQEQCRRRRRSGTTEAASSRARFFNFLHRAGQERRDLLAVAGFSSDEANRIALHNAKSKLGAAQANRKFLQHD